MTTPCQAQACLKIGLLGEFKRPTGSTKQPFGEEIKNGAELASKFLSTENGKNKCIQFEIVDIDNSLANIAGHIKVAAKKGIHLFVGLGTSDQALVSIEPLKENKSILLTPTASADVIVERSDRVVMLFPRNSQFANLLADNVKKKGYKKILAVYASNNSYSNSLHNEFKKALLKKKIKLISTEVRSGSADAAGLIKLIQANKDFDAFFVPLFELDVARVLGGLDQIKFNRPIIATDSWGTYSSVIKTLLNKNHIFGLHPVVYSPLIKTKSNLYFVKEYESTFNKKPTDLAAFSFDAVKLAVGMAEICSHDATTWKLKRCLQSTLPFQSVTGLIEQENQNSLVRNISIESTQQEKSVPR